MAPRKDMMRVIRRDAGFSATLGFGSAGDGKPEASGDVAPGESARPNVDAENKRPDARSGVEPSREEEEGRAEAANRTARAPATEPVVEAARPAGDNLPGSGRGTVVYVAVSLSARQAELAAVWARAARCSVPFLIRHVAQGLRDGICEDWQDGGMPEVAEQRGIRGKYPTSVTLTLPAKTAAAFSARYDPLGIVGLGRALGPAFRARFDTAFAAALAEAGIGNAKEDSE